jgi:hypothetical protein
MEIANEYLSCDSQDINKVKSKQNKGTKMKNKMIAAGLGMLGISVCCQQAHANANLIGSLFFNGAATVDTGNLQTATAVTSITDSSVDTGTLAPTGSYAGLAGDPVVFNTPISLEATSTPSGALLWSVTTASDIYEFFSTGNGNNVYSTSGGVTTDSLTGTGYAEEFTLADALVAGPSGGAWGITLNDVGAATLAFTGSTTTVPDGGATLMLLGGAFCGLGALRRKISSK